MILHKLAKVVGLALSIVGAVLLGMMWFKGDEETIANFQGGMNFYMVVAYIVLAIILVAVLFYVVKGLFAGDIKKTLISVGAFLLIVAISYGLSEGVETPMKDGEILTEGESRLVGAGLRTFYILAIVAIGSMLFSGIKKLIAK